jgi:ABC-type sugar transport system ATPase subunit
VRFSTGELSAIKRDFVSSHRNSGIFISHNMYHMFQSCDRMAAMARGEIVYDRPIGETSIEEVQEFL